ncbi:MAG: acetate kinase [Actinomycetia bacterium]|nr:acetate kinase [Actinomycetes bacterium]
MIIGIGNVGSTSLKSKIIDIDDQNNVKTLGQANLDKIKTEGQSNFSHSAGDEDTRKEVVEVCGFEDGIKLILDWYVANGVINKPQDIEAMGFKTILGVKNGANMLTPETLAEMKKFAFVAPVHNIPYIETIGIFDKILDVPMVGVFEPSFHYSIPEFRRYSGFPWEWYQQLGIKKNGFHGSSHRYLSAKAYQLEGTEDIRLVTIHLGGSSSMTALAGGKSVDTSMDFSPNSGLLQGTRVGDADATALLYAMKELGLTVEEAQEQISNNAGLKGTAGIGSDDMLEILAAAEQGNKRAKLAVDLYVDGIRKYIGSLATVLGGLDCMVFGGGIGEGNAYMRERILEDLEFMGIKLDLSRNKEVNGQLGLISSDYSIDSKVKVYIIPTNEEVVVASFTKKVVELGRDLKPEEMLFRL